MDRGQGALGLDVVIDGIECFREAAEFFYDVVGLSEGIAHQPDPTEVFDVLIEAPSYIFHLFLDLLDPQASFPGCRCGPRDSEQG